VLFLSIASRLVETLGSPSEHNFLAFSSHRSIYLQDLLLSWHWLIELLDLVQFIISNNSSLSCCIIE
jgi:hypothetical protein